MTVRHVLLDLDNTLYSARTGLMAALDGRIARYLARTLGVRLPQAQRLQADYCWQYGTCVDGLRQHTRLDLERFLDDVHAIDVRRYLAPDPVLAATLDRLPQHRWVFTNAPADYARRVVEALGVADRIDGIFDIRWMECQGKPHPSAYRRVLRALGVPGRWCALVDDSVRNLRPARALGMTTVLVARATPVRARWVDVVVSDLGQLPGALAVRRGRSASRPRRGRGVLTPGRLLG